MGRQPKYSVDLLLDAAAHVAAAQGPPAVTMTSVAAEAGAPSGSLYHRFADRPALLAALWLRATMSFHAAAERSTVDDPLEAAVAGAAATVRWAREQHDLACVLVGGRESLAPLTWSAEDRSRVEAEQQRFERLVRSGIEALRRHEPDLARERVALAVLDLPLAAVTRYLRSGRRVPASLPATVADAARALLR